MTVHFVPCDHGEKCKHCLNEIEKRGFDWVHVRSKRYHCYEDDMGYLDECAEPEEVIE